MQRRALLFLVFFVVSSVIAVQTGRRLVLSLTYLLGATILISLFWSWANLRWLSINRTTQTLRAQVGLPIEEHLAVNNLGWLPKLWLEVRDRSELPGHRVSRVIHGLGSHNSRAWRVRTIAGQRGRYRLGPMEIISGDPLGLFTFRRSLPQSSYITIFPPTYDLPGFAPPIGRLLGGESIQRRTQHITPNFSSVRDYVSGDSFSRIHWRSTARTGRLIVKEFEEDPTADIWLVLDMHIDTYQRAVESKRTQEESELFAWMHPDEIEVLPSTTELAVTVAASLIKHFLAQNRAVGMIAHAAEREVLQPDRGLRPLTQALEYLAVLQPEGTHKLSEVLALEEAFFTRGTTLVVVTSSPNVRWANSLRELRRRGISIISVLIDPVSFNPQVFGLDEVRTELASLGIPTYVVRQDDSIAAALGRPAGLP